MSEDRMREEAVGRAWASARGPSQGALARYLFAVGDYFAGATVAALAAVSVAAIVDEGMNMMLAMTAGMLVGMAVHVAVDLLLSPLLGLFHTMVPGSLIGMYGGMGLGMFETMRSRISLAGFVLCAAAAGLAVILAVRTWDRAMQGPTQSRWIG